MNSSDEVWLSALIVVLFGLLFFLRVKFPKASRPAETAVLLAFTVGFFTLCSLFLHPQSLKQSIQPEAAQKQAAVWGR